MEMVGKTQIDIFPFDIFTLNSERSSDDWPHKERREFVEKLNLIFERSKCFESNDENCFVKEFNLHRKTNRTVRQVLY